MQMRSCRYTADPDTSDHISFFHDTSFPYTDFRKMQITWVVCFFLASCSYSMAYYDKPISRSVCFYSTHYNTICYRKYWCSDGSPYIYTEMSSYVFLIIEFIVSHIGSDVGIVEYSRCFRWIFGIPQSKCIIWGSWYVFWYVDTFEPFWFILVCSFGPVRYIGNRHDSTVERIRVNIVITSWFGVHVRNPNLAYGYSTCEHAVGNPDDHEWSWEPFLVDDHSGNLYFPISISYIFLFGKF